MFNLLSDSDARIGESKSKSKKTNKELSKDKKEHKSNGLIKAGKSFKHKTKLYVCFKCDKELRTLNNMKNYVLSHHYPLFEPLVPKAKPYSCSECGQKSRDKITLMRHLAFAHSKLFLLTEVRREQLVAGKAGGGQGSEGESDKGKHDQLSPEEEEKLVHLDVKKTKQKTSLGKKIKEAANYKPRNERKPRGELQREQMKVMEAR